MPLRHKELLKGKVNILGEGVFPKPVKFFEHNNVVIPRNSMMRIDFIFVFCSVKDFPVFFGSISVVGLDVVVI